MDKERQWEFVLNHSDEEIRRMARSAVDEPALRPLFPYPSMRSLRFSRVSTEYPYDPMPYIRTEDPGESYELRDVDNRPLMKGSLDDVIRELARVVSSTS